MGFKFYDTSSLLRLGEEAFEEPFITSSVVLEELEHIKTSKNKTEDVRFAARKLVHAFDNHDNYEVILHTNVHDYTVQNFNLPLINDNIIVATAYCESQNRDVTFVTDDIILRLTAQNIFQLKVEKHDAPPKEQHYKGYTEIIFNNEQMASFYENLNVNSLGLLTNQYAIIKNVNNEIVDKVKWDGETYKPLKYKSINNEFIGRIKPINLEQEFAFDMLQDTNSKIKVLSGRMGSGKTMLEVINALQLIKNGKYKKILWIRNTIEVKDTKPIGFLPNSKEEKMLPFAMGLADHCGGIDGLNRLISEDMVEIEHLGFIRGRDIEDTIIIANECENMTAEHIQLLMGRLCQSSMLWLDGDLGQIDSTTFETNNGLQIAIDKLKGHSLFGYVELQKSERSEMAKLAELLD